MFTRSSETFTLRKRHIALIVMAGCLVRLLFAIYTGNHHRAHDQLSWDIALRDIPGSGGPDYKQLIHYPHEGGTFFLSLLTLCWLPLSSAFSPLSLTAFIYDTLSRLVQIIITRNIYGHQQGLIFGLWTIAAVPALLPWGSAFFGLHNSSVWLFGFLWFINQRQELKRKAVICGLFTGLAITFTYHNIILVPAFLIFLLVERTPVRTKMLCTAFYSLTCFSALIPHLLVRLLADHGFPFEPDSLLSAGRPSIGKPDPLHLFSSLITTIYYFLRSIFLFSGSQPVLEAIYTLMILAALFYLIRAIRLRKIIQPRVWLPAVMVLLYFIVYAGSSVFEAAINDNSFYSYRHFVFVIPLFFLWMTVASGQRAWGRKIMVFFIVLCALASVRYIYRNAGEPVPSYKVAGWILSRKYGDEPQRLISMQQTVKSAEAKRDLIFGYSWGYCTHLLYRAKAEDSLQIRKVIRYLADLPHEYHEDIIAGVRFAFNPSVTPPLHPEFKTVILHEIQKNED